MAPDCELYSIKVLGSGMTGRGTVFAAGLRWAIEHNMNVCNLSLGTTKRELLQDQAAHPPFGSNLTYPLADYVRLHQTSGTTGTPLRVLDTRADWDWWCECWQYVLDAAGITREDVVMLAFSFGPFIGFWGAQEAVGRLGALMLSGGGMTSAQRLHAMRELGATVLLCTPSYALHLAEEAQAEGIDPARDLSVRVAIHAGEPGAGMWSTRATKGGSRYRR